MIIENIYLTCNLELGDKVTQFPYDNIWYTVTNIDFNNSHVLAIDSLNVYHTIPVNKITKIFHKTLPNRV